LAETLLARNQAEQALSEIDAAVSNAQRAPYPMPAWRMAELRAVEGLAMVQTGRGAEGRALLAANRQSLNGYNQPAVRKYLIEQVDLRGNTAR
jgi:hypothetical protein